MLDQNSIYSNSVKLKELVSVYEPTFFFGELASWIPFINFSSPEQPDFLRGLMSPLQEIKYLCALNLSSSLGGTEKTTLSYAEWQNIKVVLSCVLNGYKETFEPLASKADSEEKAKYATLVYGSFMNYFNVDSLEYEEQIIERIKRNFGLYNERIKSTLGFDVEFALHMISLIRRTLYKKYNEVYNHLLDDESLYDAMQKWNRNIESAPKPISKWISNKGSLYQFTYEDFSSAELNREQFQNFVNSFCIERSEREFLYYTEDSFLRKQPLVMIAKDTYQSLGVKPILQAIEFSFHDLLEKSSNRDAYFKNRSRQLEIKTLEALNPILPRKKTVFTAFYVEKDQEQDLIVVANGTALIVEIKGTKRKEPFRDPQRCYEILKHNFKESIGKGYSQCSRLLEYIRTHREVDIFSDPRLQNKIGTLNTRRIKNIYSMIVTQENFGFFQTDPSHFLTIQDEELRPLCISIKDLETIVLGFGAKKKTFNDFRRYLSWRRKLFARLICDDEMEVCGQFINGSLTYSIVDSDEIVFTMPWGSGVFDTMYFDQKFSFPESAQIWSDRIYHE